MQSLGPGDAAVPVGSISRMARLHWPRGIGVGFLRLRLVGSCPVLQSDQIRGCAAEVVDIGAQLDDAFLGGNQLARQLGLLLSQSENDVWIGHPANNGLPLNRAAIWIYRKVLQNTVIMGVDSKW
jgi:hypothetical protein